MSEYVGGQLRELLGTDRVRVAPLAADHSEPSALTATVPDRLRDARYLLAVATREPRKNLPRLIEAFGLIAPQHRDLRLVVAGKPGPDDDAIAAAIGRLDAAVGARVDLLGFVADELRAALLASAAVAVFPSLDEGFGLPILEAFSANVAVVASNRGAIPEVAGPAALLVDPTDVPGLAAALLQTLDDEALATRLTAAGRERLALYSWSATADRLHTIYDEARGAL